MVARSGDVIRRPQRSHIYLVPENALFANPATTTTPITLTIIACSAGEAPRDAAALRPAQIARQVTTTTEALMKEIQISTIVLYAMELLAEGGPPIALHARQATWTPET